MIARDYITEWREKAPWVDDAQVEQDLVVSRALIDIFSNETLHDALAFRGGKALFKLYLPAALYLKETLRQQVTRLRWVSHNFVGPTTASARVVRYPSRRRYA